MHRDKKICDLILRDGRIILKEDRANSLNLEVDITPVWNFCKDVLLNTWSVDDFKREKETRVIANTIENGKN